MGIRSGNVFTLRKGVASVGLLALLVGSACGGDSNDSDAQSDDSDPTGGEIVYGLAAANPQGWCLPEAQLTVTGIQVARAIYEPLTMPNEDGEYVPYLAESVESNDTFDEWTITLREGIKFHDGSDLNAEVLKNNIDAYRGEYPTRNPILFELLLTEVTDVEVVDDLTVKISTSVPWASMPASLNGENRVGVMAQSQLDDVESCDRNLVGTGPFKMESWIPSQEFVAVRNEDYWRSDEDGNKYPYADSITFRPYLDSQTRTNALLSGEINVMHHGEAADQETLLDAEEAGKVSTLTRSDLSTVTFTMFNLALEPFSNKDARLALAHLFDPDDFNEVINNGLAEMASGAFPPGNLGYLEDAGAPEFDLDKAKAAKQRYEDATGKPLEFTVSVVAAPAAMMGAQYLQARAGEIGIDVEIESAEPAALITKVLSGDWQAAGWGNYPGGDPDLQNPWWNSTSLVNFGRINNPRIDELLAEGRAEPDPEVRDGIYQEINRELSTEAYQVWHNWVPWMIAGEPGMTGVMGPPLPDGSGPFPGLASGHNLETLRIGEPGAPPE